MGIEYINDKLRGLAPKTEEVFTRISTMECLKELFLCGGTAQSLQMGHRLSEDLDFEILGTRKERPGLNFHEIITELKTNFPDTRIEILGDEHFIAYVNGGAVKLSFYRPDNPVPVLNTGYVFNNIKAPDLQDLLGMKVFTTGVRSEARDYYDIYCLIENGCKLEEAVQYAGAFSRHAQKSKNIYARLLTPQLYHFDSYFYKLRPVYDVTPKTIKERIEKAIMEENSDKKYKKHALAK